MNLSLNWPLALLLLPLPLMWRYIKQRQRTIDSGPHLPAELAHALQGVGQHSNFPSHAQTLLLWCAWIALVLAIAQPRLPLGVTLQSFSGRDLMLVMDLSGSMEKQDFNFNGAKVTRLQVVKEVASDFVLGRNGDRIGLTVFADEAIVASPLTFDVHSIRHYIGESQIGLAGRSTALGDAMGLGLRRLNDSSSQSRVMILLTDGSNNAGDVEPNSAAELARQLGIRIHTIALGAQTMTIKQFGEDKVVDPSLDLDTDTLERIAERSGGKFYRARSTGELLQIYADIDRLERSEHTSPPFVPQRDLRAVPLSVALLCLMALR